MIDRLLVVGDANALPFKPGAFDVIIASHMIEHLDDPRPFFQEAGRVARSGLFTAPSAVRERLMGDLQHRWLIERDGNALRFIAKSQPIYDRAIHAFFMKEVVRDLFEFDDFILNHWEALELVYTWEGCPECTVTGESGVPGLVATASTTEAVVKRGFAGVEWLRNYLRAYVRNTARIFLSSHRKCTWADILACPKCHGDVIVTADYIACSSCALRFPVEQNIPIMLLDHASPVQDVATWEER